MNFYFLVSHIYQDPQSLKTAVSSPSSLYSQSLYFSQYLLSLNPFLEEIEEAALKV